MNSIELESEKRSSQKRTFFRKVKQQNALTSWLKVSNPNKILTVILDYS